ncbi:MAG: polyprenyl synthetase family protein [Bradyrhizobiaceae bacterium]|nr:polyprenyl synthetase family protein [Bradyrhizobiaceae bacterium]
MKQLSDYYQTIEDALQAELACYAEPGELYTPIKYLFDAGGKRLRPTLVLLATEAVGGNIQQAVSAALAVELLHNFTLVHDDIMDSSALRRGRPTIHVQYGENAAILSGDVMIGIGMKLLARSAVHANQQDAVFNAFAQGFIDVCEGQALDMALMHRQHVSVDEYFGMIERKTARLLEASVVIGALIGGATDVQLTNLQTFARNIGIAFQMQDDVLDLMGSEEFGKAAGGDLVEGKRTWLVLRLQEVAHQQGDPCCGIVTDFFANRGIPHSRIAEMRECMVRLGIVKEAQDLVRTLTHEAFTHLHTLPDTAARTLLEDLANGLITRNA